MIFSVNEIAILKRLSLKLVASGLERHRKLTCEFW